MSKPMVPRSEHEHPRCRSSDDGRDAERVVGREVGRQTRSFFRRRPEFSDLLAYLNRAVSA